MTKSLNYLTIRNSCIKLMHEENSLQQENYAANSITKAGTSPLASGVHKN